jgi:nitrate/nitrite-specific signal transduction histidine kinase
VPVEDPAPASKLPHVQPLQLTWAAASLLVVTVRFDARAARVELRYGQHELTVTDDGVGVAPDAVPTGAGQGLIGMRERAKLYGGTISLGPRAGGGFAVELALPT